LGLMCIAILIKDRAISFRGLTATQPFPRLHLDPAFNRLWPSIYYDGEYKHRFGTLT